MPEEPPKWREYDAPGDEPGEKIQPEPPELGKPLTLYPPGMKPPPRQGGTWSGPKTSKLGTSIGLTIAAVAGVIVIGAVALVVFAVSGGSDGLGSSPDMHTQAALDDLIDDLREEKGTSEVFRATFYPDRAYVDVHVEGGSGHRYDSMTWDGGLSEWGSSGSWDNYRLFDLADIDAADFKDFCAQVKAEVEDAGDCYIIVEAPTDGSDKGWYSAYTSNDYSEGGYIEFDRAGNEVNRSTW